MRSIFILGGSTSLVKRAGFSSQKRNYSLERARSTGGTVATVFGCTGFLGRYTVEALATSGAQVVVPYRAEEKAINHLKVLGDVGQIVPIKFSLRDVDSIERAMSHSNVVINLVGRHYETRNFSWNDVHVDGAKNIAKAAKRAGIERLVHISTIGASPTSSSELLKAKAAGEQAVQSEFPSATIMRLAPTFGPEDRLLNKFGYMFRFSPVIPSLINLQSKIQPLYALDFAAAVDAALTNEDTRGKIFELGGPEVFSVDDLIKKIIFPNLKIENGKTIQVPQAIAEKLAWFFQQTREPVWTVDEVKQYETDLVVSPEALNLKSLGITPTPIEEFAGSLLRQYRRAVRFNV